MEPEMKILVIGDAHVEQDQDLRRFDVLGKFIVEQRPEAIVSIGDFMEMACLSAWDADKRLKLEGLRYQKEIEAGNQALDLIDDKINAYNERQSENKKRQYNPQKVYIEGNHESRLFRYLERDPTFVGFADIRKDLRVDSRKWVWVPYGDDIKIRGISFTHIPFSANGKPISGNDIANKAHRVYNNSVVFGHTHQLVYQAFQRKNGSRQQVLNVGCYYEHQPDYIEKAPTAHFKGVVLMTVGEDGEFDIQTISIKSLLRDYTG
jgi:predicted phosphodiesterase